eukprot:358081-Chlamydomonas_euryale.AAC.7
MRPRPMCACPFVLCPGYNDALHLSDEVLDRLQWALPPDATYELSGGAVEFLRRAFAAADEDGDGLLTWHQLERMYRCGSQGVWDAGARGVWDAGARGCEGRRSQGVWDAGARGCEGRRSQGV